MSAVPAVATPASALEARTVPVPESLAGLLPLGGLRRGSVVAVRGPTSLLFALLSVATTRSGAWAAVVGRPDLGLVAAAESGVALERLALVPRPGPELAAVVAALLDGIELVAVAGVERLSAGDVRRLTGRVRQRGAVLLPLGDWPGADVCLDGDQLEWAGLGAGCGRLRHLRLTVRSGGRGAAGRLRSARITVAGAPPVGYAEPADVRDVVVPGPRRPTRHGPAPAVPPAPATRPGTGPPSVGRPVHTEVEPATQDGLPAQGDAADAVRMLRSTG
jgi:hypothetical protein